MEIPGRRAKEKRPQPTKMNSFMSSCRGHLRVWRPTHRCAIKEGSIVINHDWVKNLACTLSHKIHVITYTSVTCYDFSELKRTLSFLNL